MNAGIEAAARPETNNDTLGINMATWDEVVRHIGTSVNERGAYLPEWRGARKFVTSHKPFGKNGASCISCFDYSRADNVELPEHRRFSYGYVSGEDMSRDDWILD